MAKSFSGLNDSKQVYIFLAKAAIMYFLYQGFAWLYLQPNSPINQVVTYNIAAISAQLLRWFGLNATAATIQGQYNVIYLNNVLSVSIEDGCNGLVLMALFAGFVIAYPGPLLKKLYFIPAGLLLVYFINVIRVVMLVINRDISISTFDFNHKYTYTTTLYVNIFGLWMLWANVFARITEVETPEADGTAKA